MSSAGTNSTDTVILPYLVEMGMDLLRPENFDILKSLQSFFPSKVQFLKNNLSPEREGHGDFCEDFHWTLLKKDLFILFSLYECFVCVYSVPADPLELELEMVASCLPCGWWELNLGSLQEQPANCGHVL